mgnify:CR=1 FL=1
MTLATDIADDLDIADDVESVDIVIRDGQGATTATLSGVASCLRRALGRRDSTESSIQLDGNEVVWNIPDNNLSGNALSVGDRITSGSEDFSIVACHKETLGTRWRCITQQERP